MTKKLLQLLAQNSAHTRKPRLVMGYDPELDPDSDGDVDPDGEPDSDEATLFLYDAIGGWDGLDAEEIATQIAGLKAKTLHLRINSPGGEVFAARAISTAIAAFPGKVVAHIDGLAASSASFVMLAANEIEMSPGAFVMIHNPWGLAMGDSKEMRSLADLLDQIRGAIVDDYVARTGLSAQKLVDMMDSETWMDAETALANKFVDRIASRKASARAQARASAFNLSAFEHAPDALKAPPPPAADEIDAGLKAAQEQALARLRLYERAA